MPEKKKLRNVPVTSLGLVSCTPTKERRKQQQARQNIDTPAEEEKKAHTTRNEMEKTDSEVN